MRSLRLHELVREHVIEGAEAELGAVGIDVIVIGHRDAGLVGPGDAHAVEQRMQDAEADLHAMERHAARDEALHRALDEMRHRLVGDAGGDDRGGDVGLGRDVAVLHRAFVRGWRGNFETVAQGRGATWVSDKRKAGTERPPPRVHHGGYRIALPLGSSPRAGTPGQYCPEEVAG